MKLGTHMPGGERRKAIDIEDRRTKVNRNDPDLVQAF
jgi:hypothetical protein